METALGGEEVLDLRYNSGYSWSTRHKILKRVRWESPGKAGTKGTTTDTKIKSCALGSRVTNFLAVGHIGASGQITKVWTF